MSPLAWGCVLVMSYGATLFGFGSWNALLHRYPTALISPFALLIPVSGLASGALFLGESLAPVQFAGRRAGVRRPRLQRLWSDDSCAARARTGSAALTACGELCAAALNDPRQSDLEFQQGKRQRLAMRVERQRSRHPAVQRVLADELQRSELRELIAPNVALHYPAQDARRRQRR